MWELDHIAVACSDLDAGTEWVERALGVPLIAGGTHARFGTHNRLLGLAGGIYLEVIAPDPKADTNESWFGLANFGGPPRMGNWIVRVPDLDAALAIHPVAGRAVAMERGALKWQIAVPPDGSLPADGGFPTLITWGAGITPPGATLPASGCTLTGLTILHPDAARPAAIPLNDARIRFETAAAPGLRANFDTPSGPATLT